MNDMSTFPANPEALAALAVAPAPVGAHEEIVIPFNRLYLSPLNVRNRKGANIETLAALILAQGLLQNLIVVEDEAGLFGVVGGGRRFRGIELLVSRGQLPDDYPTRCLPVSLERAIELSLGENSGREHLHPADEFVAMRRLIDECGKSIEDVAAVFGVSALVVRQRLKLANVSPRLVAQYRDASEGDERITLEHLMALALCDDHRQQEKVWKALPSHQRSPAALRRLITEQEIDVSHDPVARFVGVKAYEKAGGVVRRDLFDPASAGYITDAALLHSLAMDKLESAARKVRKEGWGWVEAHVKLDYATLNTYVRAEPIRRKPTAKEAKAMEKWSRQRTALQTRIDEAMEADDESVDESIYDALEAAEAEIHRLEAALLQPDPALKAIVGALVTIDGSGKLLVHRGRIRAKDYQQQAKAQRTDEEHHDGPAEAEDKKPGQHSERLLRQLSAHRTCALRTALGQRPDIALRVLTYRLVMQQFDDGREADFLQISTQQQELTGYAPDLEDSRAFQELAAARAQLETLLADAGEDVFGWLMQCPIADVEALMAFCVAASVNAVRSNESRHPGVDALQNVLGLDMADYWTPTRASYLAHVKKGIIVAAVTEAVAPKEGSALDILKKDALVDVAEKRLEGSRWLPAPLRAA